MEQTVEQKLHTLLTLQQIDSKLDEIKKLRGDLPEEVRDIEDEIIGFETRINKFNEEIKSNEDGIAKLRLAIKESEKSIKKYEDQQQNVRNNREFDAISKEIELQQLEIQLCEKKIKEANIRIEFINKDIESTQAAMNTRKEDLASKKSELDSLVAESEDEIKELLATKEKTGKVLDERLLLSYNKLRTNYRNGLAVVLVKRDACGGCFNSIPPQRQAEIKEKKKIIVCEHCGRILGGVESSTPQETQVKRANSLKELKDA